jgi:phospholipid/cholesterol/gamma-HCH transport system substrate-binding protein
MITSKHQFRLHILGVLICVVVAVAVFLYFLSLSGISLLGGRSFTFRAAVPSAVSLATHADVREAGVKIGSLQGVTIAGDHAVLTLSIDPRYGPIYRNAELTVAAKSLAGESYVDLLPGSPAAGRLPARALIPLADDPSSTQLDQILSTFSAPRRRDVQRILDVLGHGLGGRGSQLNALLEGTSNLIDNSLPVSRVLAADRTQLGTLVQDFGTVAAALGSRRQAIETLVTAARTEATAVSARDTQVRATLTVLPSTLRAARAAVRHLGTFSVQATPVMTDLRLATQALVPAVTDLGPASAAARQTVSALSGFARVTTPAAGQLRALANVALPFLPSLEGTLRQIDPMLAYLAPYATQFGAVFGNLQAATQAQSTISHYGRLSANVNYASLAGILNPSEAAALQAILKSGLIGSAGALQSNPYPAPGTVGHPVPFTGTYPRIQADSPYGKP